MRRAASPAEVLLTVVLLSIGWATGIAAPASGDGTVALDASAAARFAGLALKCLHAEYPNHISHTLDSDADARPPQALNPAFYGCYDWHSDVHGHWLLVRLVRLFPDAPFAPAARRELARSLRADNIAGELAYLKRADRASFELETGPGTPRTLLAVRSFLDTRCCVCPNPGSQARGPPGIVRARVVANARSLRSMKRSDPVRGQRRSPASRSKC